MFQSHHTQIRDWFAWRWLLIAFALSAGGNLVAYFTLRPLIFDLLHRQERVLAGAGLLGGITLGVCLVAGFVVGRLSTLRAVREPAVASVLAVIVVFLVQVKAGMLNFAGLILGAPACFGVSYLGAWLGWKLRKRMMTRRLR